jgi:hypothetical protein
MTAYANPSIIGADIIKVRTLRPVLNLFALALEVSVK